MARFIVETARNVRPSAVLILGDVLYHGPRNPIPEGYAPKAVAETLSPLAPHVIALRGNCDSEVDVSILPFPLAPDFIWIMTENLRIFATHGHAHHPRQLPPLREHDVFLYGHTHEPVAEDSGEIALCNPGSLSLPKGGHPPTYGMFTREAFSVLTMDGGAYLRLGL